MVSGRFKSRSLRRVFVKTPGGIVKKVFKQRKPKQAKCAVCKKPLSGVPRARVSELKNMPKTYKRPERAYGGFLCPSCARETLKNKARNI